MIREQQAGASIWSNMDRKLHQKRSKGNGEKIGKRLGDY